MDYRNDAERGRLQKEATLPELNYWEASRLLYFSSVFEQIKGIEGDVVECGVGWGQSLLSIAYLVKIEHAKRNIWGFDSFSGFPEPTEEDKSPRNPKKGEWSTSMEEVYKLLVQTGLDQVYITNKITLVRGFFEKTLPKYAGKQIALLHADADLYSSYKVIYDNLFDKVVPGGIIMFDEYMNTFEYYKFPGAKKAIDETFLKRAELRRDENFGKYYAVKKE